MARKKRSFNVLLSEHESAQLERLAKQNHCARSFIVRQCLRWRFEMMNNRSPLCASGQRCFAPHLHQPVIAPLPNSDTENPSDPNS